MRISRRGTLKTTPRTDAIGHAAFGRKSAARRLVMPDSWRRGSPPSATGVLGGTMPLCIAQPARAPGWLAHHMGPGRVGAPTAL